MVTVLPQMNKDGLPTVKNPDRKDDQFLVFELLIVLFQKFKAQAVGINRTGKRSDHNLKAQPL